MELTSAAFEGTSNAVSHGNLITVLMNVVTADLVADSADTTPEGYKKATVEKILKAQDAKPAMVGMSAAQLDKWLND